MKRSPFIPFWLMAAVLFSYSCGSNENTKTESTSTDTATAASTTPKETTPTSTVSTTPTNLMVVTHKVKDFNSWKAAYDAHDSMRLASGIHSYVVGRGAMDTSMVLVATKVDDVSKAKEFGKSANLKQAMQKSGVVGAPMMKFVVMVWMDTGKINTDLRSRTSITVKDWDHWQHSFDSTMKLPTDNGLVVRAYGHDLDDNHKVTIVSAITDTAKAMAYWKSDLLKQRRVQSGAGEPVRFVYHMVQRY